MADTTGPISSLPGAHHAVPKGTTCDDHPDRTATHRVQGETDSFGCEMIDMCDECYKAYREEIKTEDTSGTCDWCNNFAQARRPTRDYEEGMSGRVYYVCDACVTLRNKRLEEEDDSRFDYHGEPDRDEDWEGYIDEYEYENGDGPIPGTGSQPVVKPYSVLDDFTLAVPTWEVDLACVKLGRYDDVKGYVTLTYYVKARGADLALQRAQAMLPKFYDVDDVSSCRVKPFVPVDAKTLRLERDAAKRKQFYDSLPGLPRG